MDISGHQGQLDSLSSQAQKFEDDEHFDAVTIMQRQKSLVERYKGLQIPLKKQKERLEASHQLQQFFRDVEDEWAWIKERESLAASTNTGEFGVKCIMRSCQLWKGRIYSEINS